METEGGSQLLETAEKGGVMKMGHYKGENHENMCRGSPTEEKKVLYFVKKPGRNRRVE